MFIFILRNLSSHQCDGYMRPRKRARTGNMGVHKRPTLSTHESQPQGPFPCMFLEPQGMLDKDIENAFRKKEAEIKAK